MRRNPTNRVMAALTVAVGGSIALPALAAPPAGAAIGDSLGGTLTGGAVSVVEGLVSVADGAAAAPAGASVEIGQGSVDAALELAGTTTEVGLDTASGLTAGLALTAGEILRATGDLALGPQGLSAGAGLEAPPVGLDVGLDAGVSREGITVGVGGAGIRADLDAGVDLPAAPTGPLDVAEQASGNSSAAPAPAGAVAEAITTDGWSSGAMRPGGPLAEVGSLTGEIGEQPSDPEVVAVPDGLHLVSARARLVDDTGGLSSALAMLTGAGTRVLPGLLLLGAALVMRRRAQALFLAARSTAAVSA